MGLLWEILKDVAREEDANKKTAKEKKMDNYGLKEWQKELVRKGDYAPWNFEESGELDEDDYYYEDDEN